MIVVGSEGMHTGVTHMHEDHSLTDSRKHTLIHTEQVQGRRRNGGYFKKGELSKTLQAVTEEAART